MSVKNYLTASDVSEYMGISIPMAYKIIRRLNDELKSNGYITISGKDLATDPIKSRHFFHFLYTQN